MKINSSYYLNKKISNYRYDCSKRRDIFIMQIPRNSALSFYFINRILLEAPIRKTQLIQMIEDTSQEINKDEKEHNLLNLITRRTIINLDSCEREVFDIKVTTGLISDILRFHNMTILPHETTDYIPHFLNSLFTKIINRETYIKEQKLRKLFSIKNETFAKTMNRKETYMINEELKKDLEQYENMVEDFCSGKEIITGQSKETREEISKKITEEISEKISKEMGKEISEKIKGEISIKISKEISKNPNEEPLPNLFF